MSWIGDGVKQAEWEVTLPVVYIDDQGNPVLEQLNAAVLSGGTADDLPCLIGLETLSERRAIINCARGKMSCTFPGPGEVLIQWLPGTVHMPCVNAPSGHMVVPCDEFKAHSRAASSKGPGGLTVPVATLHAEPTQPEETPTKPKPVVFRNYFPGSSSSSAASDEYQ